MRIPKFLILMLFSVMLISLISALDIPSQVRITGSGCQILTPDFTELKQNTNFTFYFHVYNQTSYMDNKTANCTFHLYSSQDNGLHIFIDPDVSFLSPRDFVVFVDGANFSQLGRYSYLFECAIPVEYLKYAQSDVCGMEQEFEVTPTGQNFDISQSLLFGCFLFLLILFLVGGVYGLSRAINGAWQIAYICLAYLSLFMIFFVSWLYSSNYLWATPILISFFWISWLIMAFGFFPFILVIGTYIVGKGISDNLFKQYRSEGYSEEEARDMAKRKRH